MVETLPQERRTSPRVLAEAVRRVGESWPDSESAQTDAAPIEDAVDRFGGLESGRNPVAIAAHSALAFAILTASGAVREADPAFFKLGITEGDASILRLLRRARGGDPAVGLVELTGGGLAALCAASPSQTEAWPLSDTMRSTANIGRGAWVVMAFAPTRSFGILRQVTAALSFSELEARVAEALIEAPTLKVAAARVGVGGETAREALTNAMRKAGVRSTPAFIRRLIDLMCGLSSTSGDQAGSLAAALGLTPAEAEVARLSGQGTTAATVAELIGVKRETVRTHLRAAFAKSGLARAKDIGRVDAELQTLEALASAQELVPLADEAEGELRVISRPDGRRVAYVGYGPQTGHPVVIGHALASGRTVHPRLLRALRSAQFRPIVPQRPGFGLTDPPSGDYLRTAAEDLAAILDSLRLGRVEVFARDIGAAPLLAFAAHFPERVGGGVLLNPQAPDHQGGRRYAITAASQLHMRHPEIARAFFEVLRRQTGSEKLAAMLRESFVAGAPSDAEGLRDAELLHWMVRDIQAMFARTIEGVVAERLIYTGGWRPPARAGGDAWTVAHCVELESIEPDLWWRRLPNVRFEPVVEGGLLLQLTHPETVARLLSQVRDRAGDARRGRESPNSR